MKYQTALNSLVIEEREIFPIKQKTIFDGWSISRMGELGPEIYLQSSEKPILAEDDLLKIMVFFHLAIGQGEYYNQGIYGPLPVLGTKYQALIYTTRLIDLETVDPRLRNQNYLVFAIFVEKEKDLVIRTKILRETFEKAFASISSITDLTENVASDLYQEISKIVSYS